MSNCQWHEDQAIGEMAMRECEQREEGKNEAIRRAIKVLDVLIYWNERGHIDSSWWDEARDAVAALRAEIARAGGEV